LWPDEPEATVVERNASPHPPAVAVVESPARSQYTGFDARSSSVAGAARTTGRMARIGRRMLSD
jgi:non-ribosomal peptide synthetase component E (peptide arylation enzyme)